MNPLKMNSISEINSEVKIPELEKHSAPEFSEEFVCSYLKDTSLKYAQSLVTKEVLEVCINNMQTTVSDSSSELYINSKTVLDIYTKADKIQYKEKGSEYHLQIMKHCLSQIFDGKLGHQQLIEYYQAMHIFAKTFPGSESKLLSVVSSFNVKNESEYYKARQIIDMIMSYFFVNNNIYHKELTKADTQEKRSHIPYLKDLEEATHVSSGSYFLQILAKEYIGRICDKDGLKFLGPKSSGDYFQVTKNQYGVVCLGGGTDYTKMIPLLTIKLTPVEDFEEASKLFSDYNTNTLDSDSKNKLNGLFKKQIEKEIITADSISENKAKNTETQIDVEDFLNINISSIRLHIENEWGIKFTELGLQEQFYLLHYLKFLTDDDSEIMKVKKFSEMYGVQGFRSFLSIQQGGKEMGDKILTLGDETKFPRPLAEKLFSKYGSFVDSANNIQEEIEHLVGDIRTLDTSKISEKLLVRAKNLLVEYADNAKAGDVDEKKIDEDLEHIHKEIAILGYAYIEMARQGDYADLEDLGKVEVAVRTTTEYTTQEKDELEKVYIYSRPKETFDNKEHVELLKKEFRETLEREDVTVFDVTLDNKKIAFALLYYKDPKTLHMGGLSFHPDARNPAVGLAVMESMAKNLSAYAIEAEVHNENKILAMYTNRFGFEIVGEEPREKNAGELYYIIRREPTTVDPRSAT